MCHPISSVASRLSKYVVVFASVALLTSMATAQVVTPYYTRAAFDLAADPTTTINFEGILAPNESSHIFPTGFTVSGVNFLAINPGNTPTSFIEVADGLNLGAAGTDVVYSLNNDTDMVFTTQITLPLGGVLAFGTDIKFNDSTWSSTFMVQLFSGANPLGIPFVTQPPFTPLNFNQFGFIGFTSDTPITSLQIGMATPIASGPDGNVVLDNVSFGAPVPEPAAWALLLAGLAPLLMKKRRS